MTTVLSDIACGINLAATLSKTSQGATASARLDELTVALSLSTGTIADSADIYYQQTDTALLSAANDDLDMYDLASFAAAVDFFGAAIVNVEIVALAIRNQASSSGDLVFGGEGSAAAWNSLFSASDTSTMTLTPGGIFLIALPENPALTVADTSNHLLRINASGGNITYDLAFLGRSA